MSSKAGMLFGASNYACEFSLIPYEIFIIHEAWPIEVLTLSVFLLDFAINRVTAI